MAGNWWREPDMGVMSAPLGVPEARGGGCAAQRMWRGACGALAAPDADDAWHQLVAASPPDELWHTLRNCVAYQAGVWQNMLNKGMEDVIQPAAFKLAIVLRHTPSELTVKLLTDLLRLHPQSQDLMSYILALLTDDEAQWCGSNYSTESGSSTSASPASSESESGRSDGGSSDEGAHTGDTLDPDNNEAECGNEADAAGPREASPAPAPGAASPAPPEPDSTQVAPDSTLAGDEPRPDSSASGGSPTAAAPRRDLRLFGDCELAVLAASREEYDAHAKLVRAEYSKLTHDNYVQLRIKVLDQFTQIPKLYHTPEFEGLEAAARENIEREICTLREHLLTGRRD